MKASLLYTLWSSISLYLIAISSFGAAEVNVLVTYQGGGTAAFADVSPISLGFGPVGFGSIGDYWDLEIGNPGDTTLTVVDFSGVGRWEILGMYDILPLVVDAGTTSSSVRLRMQKGPTGTFNEDISIVSNVDDFVLRLSGEIQVVGSSATYSLYVSKFWYLFEDDEE